MELEAFADHIHRNFPGLQGSRVVIALSGGADSTALLHLLNQSNLGLTLFAAHVHHGARGNEADEDAQFCREICQTLGIAYTQIRLDDAGPPSGQGREADWRNQRYAALERTAVAVHAIAIATAHHRDDVAEGVLLQLLRGAGPRAMAGIHSWDQNVVRPLLPFSAAQIRKWLLQQNLTWREDSSNASPEHLRNRIRHEVLPQLEGIAPSIRTHLIRLAHALADSENYMAKDLEDQDLWIDPWHPDGGIPVDAVAQWPRALQIRWLHSQVARVGLPGATHRQGELLPKVLSGAATALTLAERWVLRRAGGRLWLDGGQTIPTYRIDLEVGLRVDLPIPGWNITVHDGASNTRPSRWTFPISTQLPLYVRCVRPDDRFEDGRRPSTVLRSFLPRHLRRIWPILFGGDKLLWIPGVTAETVTVDRPRVVEVTCR